VVRGFCDKLAAIHFIIKFLVVIEHKGLSPLLEKFTIWCSQPVQFTSSQTSPRSVLIPHVTVSWK